MLRRDPEYWQRLRKDSRSNIAGLLTAVAAIVTMATLTMTTLPGSSQYEARANPLYWLIMIPIAWWIVGLSNYEPRFVRTWKAGLALLCLASAICLWLAVLRDQDVMLTVFSFAITQISAIASMIAYRGSLVDREGPAR